MTTPDEVLEKAAEILERDGWYQGKFTQWGGEDDDDIPYEQALAERPVCALGAINRALTGQANRYGELFQLWNMAYYRLQVGAGLTEDQGIPGWNDDPARSKEDVLLAFKKAIAHGDSA